MFGNAKKRIGIFGDSYAYPKTDLAKDNPIAWPILLSKNFNIAVMCGRTCTSIFYAYMHFLENYKNLDIIIFVATEPNRLYHSNYQLKVGEYGTVRARLEKMTEQDPNYIYYKAAELYHLWLSDSTLNNFISEKCLESIKNICDSENKQLIVVPAFDDSIKFSKHFTTSLVRISEKEYNTQFNERYMYKKEHDTRACHMSAKNNAILADFVTKIINDENIQIGLNDFVFEKVNDPENYWVLS